MKKNLLIAVSLMAATAVSAQVNLERFQNLEFSNVPANLQVEQVNKHFAIEQVQGVTRNDLVSGKVTAIKDVKVTAKESAYYYLPQDFYLGFSTGGGAYSMSMNLAKAFGPMTWSNASGNWATSFEWEYLDLENSTPEQTVTLTSTEKDLTIEGTGCDVVPAPMLTAKGGDITSTYGFGGTPDNTTLDGNGFVLLGSSFGFLQNIGALSKDYGTFGAGTYDVGTLKLAYYGDENTNVSGKDATTAQLGIQAFVNVFDKPVSPYFIDNAGIWAIAQVNASDDAAFTMTIYNVEYSDVVLQTKTGKDTTVVLPVLKSEIAHCTKTFGQMKAGMELAPNGNLLGALVFDAFVAEDEFGYESDVVPVIDGPVAVAISGFDSDKVKEFIIATNRQVSDPVSGGFDRVANFRLKTHYYVLSSAFDPEMKVLTNFYDSFSLAVFMDATFPWLHSADTEFVAPVEGGNKKFDVNMYLNPLWKFVVDGNVDNAVAVNPENPAAPVAVNDWITATVNIETGALTFTAAALPEGVKGRSAKVVISDFVGCEEEFSIVQGDAAGVADVNAQLNVAKVVNGNIEVASASANAVEVFNVAGQKVAEAQFEGQGVVDAQNLANGMYIVKFNDNSVVKVLK